MGGGKTAAAVMCSGEPSLDSRFRAVYLRNNLGDLKSGGGILDEFKKIYGKGCNVVAAVYTYISFMEINDAFYNSKSYTIT